ncbi:MAG: recombinase family protein [Planctomycetes bacterium]|nr:recombinase family protein [Planctomycetota bacterium]
MTASHPEQEEACRRYAQNEDLGQVIRIERENQSGTSGFDRPKFRALVEAAERGEFDVFLTLDMSRFGRFTPDERGYWVTLLKQVGVSVRHVMDDARLAGEAGPIMGAILQTGQREHSLKTAYKVAMGAVAAAKQGFWPGGTVSYGYRLERKEGFDGTGKRSASVKVVPGEAAIVQEMFRLRGELGLSHQGIATRLRAAGHRTKKGRNWTGNSVRYVLKNPLYKGELVRGGSRGARKAKFFHGSLNGPLPVAGPSPCMVFKNVAPPIVSEELWGKVQVLGAARRREFSTEYTGPRLGGAYLLTGLTQCGACGLSAVANAGSSTRLKDGTQRRYAYYTCNLRTRGSDREPGCERVKAPTQALGEAVLEQVRRVTAQINPKTVAAILRERLAARLGSGASVDVAALKRARARLAQRRRELVLAETEFERLALSDLAEEDARLAEQIAAEERRVQAGAGSEDFERAIERAVASAQALEFPATPEGRAAAKTVLRSFVREIRIMPSPPRRAKKIELELYTPEGMGELFITGAGSSTKSRSPRPSEV